MNMTDPKFYVIQMTMLSHEFIADRLVEDEVVGMVRMPGSLKASINLDLQGLGNFTEYLNPDRTIDKDKLSMAIFSGQVKLVFL